MRKILMTLSFGLAVLSCTLKPKIGFIKLHERQNFVIPDSLYSFFPDDKEACEYLKREFTAENANKPENEKHIPEYWSFPSTVIIEVYRYDNNESMQQLNRKYHQLSLSSLRSENNDYYIIGSEEELLEKNSVAQLRENYETLGNAPLVFNFSEFFNEDFNTPQSLCDTTTICGLPPGYEILILKSGNKLVLPQKHTFEWSVLPDEIKHGYRSGVAIKEDEQRIIYWVVAW